MSTLDVRCVEQVGRSPEVVWRYVAAEYFAHHATWDPAIVGMEQLTSGPIGVGTEGVEARRLGRVQRTRFRVTDFDAPLRFALTDETGPFALDRSYELQPHDGGTRVTFRFTMRPRGVMRLVFPLLRRGIERQVRGNIARLPGAVEALTGNVSTG